MIMPAAILVSVLLTSVLSGVLGMAGGMILMAVLISMLPVATAMVIHGAVQATSNGSRAWFLRRHIQWHIFPAYVVGAATAVGGFVALTLIPDADVVLILVGVFPFLARLTPRLNGLDVTHAPTAVACGAVVTSAQLLAGASGPLLDVFYLNASLNRYQIIASKALTQTLGHLLKLAYYGFVVSAAEPVSATLLLVAMAVAVVGTRLGTWLLERLPDDHFRRVSGYVILTIAGICLAKGVLGVIGR